MINQFPFQMPGEAADFNAVIDSMPGEFEHANPLIPLPEQRIILDSNENYNMNGIQPSSIIDADAGGCDITFSGNLSALGDTTRISVLVFGVGYSITAGGITFEMTDGPCIIIGTSNGWRALTIGSQIVDTNLADGIFTSVPASLVSNVAIANAWVQDEIKRYIRILNMGELNDYQKMIDYIPNPATAGQVTFPAPPLAPGLTTLAIEAWKGGVHRVKQIPESVGTVAHTINFDLAPYTQDETESGDYSTAFVHFESSEVNQTILFSFVNMPPNMNWGLNPVDVATTVSGLNVVNFHGFRIDRIEQTLFFMPHTISPT